MYRIQILKSADKTLRNLPNKTRRKIALLINSLSQNPRPSSCKKLKNSEFYRIRVGDYRILYTIEDDILVVLIIKIGHRKDIYRQM